MGNNQTAPERPKVAISIPILVPVIVVDEKFVVGIGAEAGRWALPYAEIPPGHGIDVVLKKFLTETLHISLADLVQDEKNHLHLGTIYTRYNAERNMRQYQHVVVIHMTRETLEKCDAPADFAMLPLDQLVEAPEALLVDNHLLIVIENALPVGGGK